ncbi:MAG: hypothetical protein ACTHNP_10165 [Solirubrobacterales bacterium]
MKYVKILGLAAMAAMAVMAFAASSASATVLSGSGGNLPKGTVIDASLEKGTTAILEVGSTTLDTCTASTIKGKTTNAGGAGVAVEGNIETLTWGEAGTSCSSPTTTIKTGKLSISWTSGNNGTLVGKGTEVTIQTIFGSCVYGTSEAGTTIGTVEGGSPAKISISTSLPLLSGPCPNPGTWTAHYTVTEPNPLLITKE